MGGFFLSISRLIPLALVLKGEGWGEGLIVETPRWGVCREEALHCLINLKIKTQQCYVSTLYFETLHRSVSTILSKQSFDNRHYDIFLRIIIFFGINDGEN